MATDTFVISALLLLFYFTPICSGSMSTDPEYIAEVENEMANALRLFVDVQSEKLAFLSMQASFYEKQAKEHSKDLNTDPMSLYREVKSLANQWENIAKAIRDDKEFFNLPTASEEYSQWNLPSLTDVDRIVDAIFRIQDTYRLSAADIVAMATSDKPKAKKVTARDCFDIGMTAFSASLYNNSLMWLLETHSRLNNESKPTLKEIELLPPLAIALHETNNREQTSTAINDLKKLFENVGSADKEKVFQKFPRLHNLMEETYDAKKYVFDEKTTPEKSNARDNKGKRYEALCRGEGQKLLFTNPNLTCFYEKTRPFLRLAAAKVETLNIDPLILLYHNVISDNETVILQSLVKDELTRGRIASVSNPIGGLSKQRTSSIAWLLTDVHPLVKTLRQRVGTLTGLDMTFAEELQMARYGIAGHYYAHHDYIHEKRKNEYGYYGAYNKISRDRVATFMYYLSEPDRGGATVFPLLNITILPSKNNAVFWYNLDKSGKGMYKTAHGGCPVVAGTKWVANQWIKEGGQEFLRLCGLFENE